MSPLPFTAPKLLLVASACTLLAACTFPRHEQAVLPDASVIRVSHRAQGWLAEAPDCAALYPSERRWQHDKRPQFAFGCATYTNLGHSVANPQDLVLPREYGGAQTDAATRAVTRYREGKTEPLRETTSTTLTGE